MIQFIKLFFRIRLDHFDKNLVNLWMCFFEFSFEYLYHMELAIKHVDFWTENFLQDLNLLIMFHINCMLYILLKLYNYEIQTFCSFKSLSIMIDCVISMSFCDLNRSAISRNETSRSYDVIATATICDLPSPS